MKAFFNKTIIKLLIAAGLATALSGCVVVPARGHAYVAAPAVVVHPYGGYYYGRRW